MDLPDSAVKESRERVTAAIKNSGFEYPLKKITVNLAPADIKKEGSSFDSSDCNWTYFLHTGLIESNKLNETVFLGELSLDGKLRPVKGALANYR
ncbi:MAG: hypothetical protein MZV64_21495 [Ignavibacteriales bacterium]|nr:hypothetical protein [Ignavibacteriales bacterium]